MASTFVRSDSPFIWIRFKNPQGKWQNRPTQYRKSVPGDKRKSAGEMHQARLLAREMTLEERTRRSAKTSEQWAEWVDRWLADNYGGKPQARTLALYQRHWWNLLRWLRGAGILVPMQMSYRAALEYREARLIEGASNNYTIMELKLLSRIMNEAVRRGFAVSNPLQKMGLKKDEPKGKLPWSDEEIALVDRAVRSQPQWMRVTFLLGLYQAARMSQCEVPLADIDCVAGRISYWRTIDGRPLTKGNKPFAQPIDPRLLPELRRLVKERKAAGFRTLCDLPAFGRSLEWRRFLDGLNLRGLCHHGLRATWITRAAKSGQNGERGISLAEAKRFVNHGSTAVHEIYQRLNADDISHVAGALRLPDLPSS